MMSDPMLRGKTSWLLITARIHLLSPDIRRPGRAGSLIIPVLDPVGEDLDDFVSWMIAPVFRQTETCNSVEDAAAQVKPFVKDYYPAAFAEVKSDLIATAEIRNTDKLTIDEIREVIEDHIPPPVEKTRRYQTLQSLLNCTRLSLLPNVPKRSDIQSLRDTWRKEIQALEEEGM